MTDLIRPVFPASSPARSSADSCSASGPSAAMPGTFVRVVDEPHRQPLLGARLGEVEARRLAGRAEVDAQRDRAFAGLQRRRGQLVRPAQPAGPRQMGDQDQLAGPHAEVFAPPVGAGNGQSVQRVDRRVEGLEHRQRGDVDAADGLADGVATQVVGQRFDFGQFGHVSSVPVSAARRCGPPATAPSSTIDKHDRGPDRGPPEVVDGQAPVGGVLGDPRGDPQHQRVDDDVEQAQREDVERDRQDLHDRFDEGVDQTEDHRDDEDDADPLQAGVAADEAEPVDDVGDHPQRESGERGANDECSHAGEPTTGRRRNA